VTYLGSQSQTPANRPGSGPLVPEASPSEPVVPRALGGGSKLHSSFLGDPIGGHKPGNSRRPSGQPEQLMATFTATSASASAYASA
jgi:hypothetical protein